MSPAWLGLDLGTSSLKGLLVDDEGRVLGRGRGDYPTHRTGVRVEQDATNWQGALRDVVAQCCGDRAPDGVALVGHTPSLVLAGAHREAVARVLTWQDARAVDEARELADRCGPAEDLVGTDLPWAPSYLPAKLLWAARYQAEAVGRTRWLLQPKDYLAYLLTGKAATDLWSAKGLCRVDDGRVVREVFAAAGVDPDLLPARRDPWHALGAVDAEGEDRTGLPRGTPVAVGWSDALAGMLALGVFEEPRAFLLTGTSDIAGISGRDADADADADAGDAGDAGATVLSIPATCAPLPVRYGPTQTSGASLAWLAGLLGREPAEVARISGRARAEAVPRFLPYLDGERAPLWRPDVRAILQGLSLETGDAELARAVMRGVALSDRHVIDTAMGGGGFPEVHLGGSAASSPEWVRVRLEAFGTPVHLHREIETAALGACVLAASAGTGRPVAAVAARLVAADATSTPDAADTATSAELYDAYRADVRAALRRLDRR